MRRELGSSAGAAAGDAITNLYAAFYRLPSATGGLGGFKAELPPQSAGAVYYQVVGCDSAGAKCAISTGSKRRWHAVAVAPSPVAKPAALQVASSKAPASISE